MAKTSVYTDYRSCYHPPMLTVSQIRKVALMLEQTGGRDGPDASELMSARIDREMALRACSLSQNEGECAQVEDAGKKLIAPKKAPTP